MERGDQPIHQYFIPLNLSSGNNGIQFVQLTSSIQVRSSNAKLTSSSEYMEKDESINEAE